MELLKLLNANEIVAQILGFLLMLFLLRIFAWKKLLSLLDARKEKIASEFKKIGDTQAEIAKLKAEYDVKLGAIEEAARQKVQEAISDGKRISQEIREQAQQDARAILEKARENIELEIAKAKVELKEKLVDLTVSATEKIIKEKLTEEKDKRLVSDFLEKLERIK